MGVRQAIGTLGSSASRALSVALTALFAALYAGLVASLPFISFQVFQVRVADALLPLAIPFGWPAILGFTIGCFAGNFAGIMVGIPASGVLVDACGGAAANFLGCYLAHKLAGSSTDKRRLLAATFVITAVLTAIVGTYLPLILGLPIWLGWAGIFLGSLVAVNLLGYPLLLAVLRLHLARLTPSRGIP